MKSVPTDVLELMKQEQEVATAERILSEEKEKYEQKMASGWNSYKHNYIKYINNEYDGNA